MVDNGTFRPDILGVRFFAPRPPLFSPADDGGGDGGGGGTGAGQGASTEQRTDEAPPWFRDYTAKIDKRLGDMGRQFATFQADRKGGKGDEPPAKPEGQPEGASLSRDDVKKELLTARRYGELMGKLSDKARQRLEAMEEEGRSITELLDAASLALELQADAPSNGQQRPSGPRGHGATPAAPTVSDAWPKTYGEAAKLRREKPDVLDRFIDQGLDLDRLPG